MSDSRLGTPIPLLFAAGLQTADYAVVLAYLAGMLGIGIYLAKTQRTTEEFFVGDRRMPWWAVGMSMLATLMSTLTYLGLPGEMIQHGVALAVGWMCLPLVFLVVGYVWVPFFMRLRLTSAYEYLDRRFGPGTRWLAVVLYLYMRLVWMGAIVKTVSEAVAQITQDSGPQALASLTGGAVQLDKDGWFYFVLLVTGVVTTLYTALGGIKAVIWTDVVQFLCLFAGAVLTLLVIAGRTGTGPVDWWIEATRTSHDAPALFSWDLNKREVVFWTLLGGFMWHVCTHASDQVALQRYFTTRSASDARRVAAVNYVLDAIMAVLLAMVGMALLTYFVRNPSELPQDVSDPRDAKFADHIFPHFIAYGLPVGVSGLVVAAVFAVAQSSLDSGINSTATVIIVNVIRRHRSQPLSESGELRLAQWLTLAIGMGVTLTGLAVTLLPHKYNIIDMQMKSFNCVLGPLGAIFMAGILLPHVGSRAVLTGGIIGTLCGVSFAFADLVPGWRSPAPYLLIPLSWIVTFTLTALLGGVLRRPAPEQVRGLTWQSAMRGESAE
ncbi:MAG: hypothetical protein HY000_08130 [Planctomycetes bacterium]|nr:hypothetical protein [Planctomycetota bacterium]